MCGRYTLKTPVGDWLQQLFDFDLPPPSIAPRPRYNIAPTQSIVVLRQTEDGPREWSEVKWGLIPSWAKDARLASSMINARSESYTVKPAFRQAAKRRRCAVIADGYYEWHVGPGGKKQPYWLHRADERPFFFAGLWEYNSQVHPGHGIVSASILTTSMCDSLGHVHDRMPVTLRDQRALDDWLDVAQHPPESLTELITPAPDGFLEARLVSTLVNSPRNETPSCIAPLTTH